jgi:hypothetical protein
MTWDDLKYRIEQMTPEQRDTDVTFYDHNDEEFYQIRRLLIAVKGEQAIDEGHPYLEGLA